jgi:hypothetical protein
VLTNICGRRATCGDAVGYRGWTDVVQTLDACVSHVALLVHVGDRTQSGVNCGIYWVMCAIVDAVVLAEYYSSN